MTELNETCCGMKEVTDKQIFNKDMLHQGRSHDFFLLHLSHSHVETNIYPTWVSSFTHNSNPEMQLSTYSLKNFVEHTPAHSQYMYSHKWKCQSVNIHIKPKK
jgi:hypothetical protein